MIKLTELRIGNWIEFIENGSFCYPIGIDINGLEVVFPTTQQVFDGFDKFKPIPLTEEWLIKFGFKNNITSNILFWHDIVDYQVIYSVRSGSGYYLRGINIKIKYVHQLQNLIYALTREELLIK